MLTLGNKIIAGSFKSGASWEVGDVGISALGIDESLNKRRYLNGQVISQTQFVQFTAFLKSRVSVYPSLATTEVNWQAAVTNSDLGQCGKFVIDDDAGTIRLPKVVNIQGLQDLSYLGDIKSESLPNIKGDATYQANYNKAPTGPFVNSADTRANTLGATAYITAYSLEFDASRSSSTYQDDAPVQQEAVQYPYFIQVAEGIENSIDVSREIELNNPFSLLDYKYSEYEISNASWLLSNGQWNSGSTYADVYDLLLEIYNGTVTKAGVSVKLSTETYADTDFVLNTSDTTFRLPIKVLMAGSKRIAGNGMTLGLTNGTTNSGLTEYEFSGADHLGANPLAYGEQVTTGSTIGSMIRGYTGITTDETKSGIETSANGLYLYFYVGDTVQDANVIAAGQALTDIANLKNLSNISDNGTSTGASWAMPSNRYDTLTIGASGATYTAPANGYFVGWSNNFLEMRYEVYGVGIFLATQSGVSGGHGFLPVKKGDVITIEYNGLQTLRFYYAEGEPNV